MFYSANLNSLMWAHAYRPPALRDQLGHYKACFHKTGSTVFFSDHKRSTSQLCCQLNMSSHVICLYWHRRILVGFGWINTNLRRFLWRYTENMLLIFKGVFHVSLNILDISCTVIHINDNQDKKLHCTQMRIGTDLPVSEVDLLGGFGLTSHLPLMASVLTGERGITCYGLHLVRVCL